jgi:hypothetical protein
VPDVSLARKCKTIVGVEEIIVLQARFVSSSTLRSSSSQVANLSPTTHLYVLFVSLSFYFHHHKEEKEFRDPTPVKRRRNSRVGGMVLTAQLCDRFLEIFDQDNNGEKEEGTKKKPLDGGSYRLDLFMVEVISVLLLLLPPPLLLLSRLPLPCRFFSSSFA